MPSGHCRGLKHQEHAFNYSVTRKEFRDSQKSSLFMCKAPCDWYFRPPQRPEGIPWIGWSVIQKTRNRERNEWVERVREDDRRGANERGKESKAKIRFLNIIWKILFLYLVALNQKAVRSNICIWATILSEPYITKNPWAPVCVAIIWHISETTELHKYIYCF